LSGIRKSLPAQRIVHGINIKKLPIGAYLTAFESVGDLPINVLSRLFPGLSTDEALLRMKNIDTNGILTLIARAVAVIPDEFLGFVSIILEVDVNKIRNEMTPCELADVLSAFWQANDIENFIRQVRGAVEALR